MNRKYVPLVSVVMPVYNAQQYVGEAIRSVLNQTLEDFELIIVDDGSTDKTQEIILSFKDVRIKYYLCEHNYIKTLNYGMCLAVADFVARMDADDVMCNNRLEIQYQYMKSNTNIAVCGSWMNCFSDEGVEVCETIELPEDIDVSLLQMNPIAHPTTMLRRACIKSLLKKHNSFIYHPKYKYAEDYYLWCELVSMGYKISNIPIVLMNYRISENQITRKNYDDMVAISMEVQKYYFEICANNMIKDVPQLESVFDVLINLLNWGRLSFDSLKNITYILYRDFLTNKMQKSKSMIH